MKFKKIGAKNLFEGFKLNGFSVKRENDTEAERTVFKNGIPIDDTITGISLRKGGILVFPSDKKGHPLPDDLFIRSVTESLKPEDNLPEQDTPYGLAFGFFVKGKYHAEEGLVYDNCARGVEIIGITTEILDRMAQKLAKELQQGKVLVKNYETDKLYLIG